MATSQTFREMSSLKVTWWPVMRLYRPHCGSTRRHHMTGTWPSFRGHRSRAAPATRRGTRHTTGVNMLQHLTAVWTGAAVGGDEPLAARRKWARGPPLCVTITIIGSTGRPDSDPPNCGGWSSGTQLICSPAPCWRGEGVFTSVLFIFFSNNSIFSTHDHTFFPLCMWNFSIKQCVAWYVVGVESPMSYTVWKFQPKFWLLSMIKTDLLEKNHFTDFLH